MIRNLLKIINHILVARGKSELQTISNFTKLRDDIGFDSLDLAELTVNIEVEYGIDVFEDGIVETVGEIIQKLEKVEN